MNSPSFDNIDRWLFDYVEGNLSSNQESILERYILNHPELEVDLDMWRMSNIKMSSSFVNDIQIVKKSSNRKIYALINTVGIILILLIGRQVHINEVNKTALGQLNHPISEHESVSINTGTASNYSFNDPIVKTDNDRNNVNPSRLTATRVIANTNHFRSSEINTSLPNGILEQIYFNPLVNKNGAINDIAVVKLELNNDLELTTPNKDLASIEGSMPESDDAQTFSFRDKSKNIINRIDRLLSKNLALSNYRDHYYLIPETSSIDANISSVGSVSQARMQSTTRMRWLNTKQSKLSEQLSFDTYARGIRSGIGAQLNYDYFADGTIQDWNGALIISPKIALSRNILLEPVAKLKIGNKLLDANKAENNALAIFNSDSPQIFSFDTSQNIGRKLWYRDLDFGLTLNTNIFYIGAQATNILSHSENIYQNNQTTNYRTPTVYSAFMGTQYVSRNEKISFHPYLYFRSVQKNKEYYTGFSLDLDKVYLGASFDFQNQYTGSIGLSLDRFALILQSSRSHNTDMNQNLYIHQLTIRFNSDISKKTRRYITF